MFGEKRNLFFKWEFFTIFFTRFKLKYIIYYEIKFMFETKLELMSPMGKISHFCKRIKKVFFLCYSWLYFELNFLLHTKKTLKDFIWSFLWWDFNLNGDFARGEMKPLGCYSKLFNQKYNTVWLGFFSIKYSVWC